MARFCAEEQRRITLRWIGICGVNCNGDSGVARKALARPSNMLVSHTLKRKKLASDTRENANYTMIEIRMCIFFNQTGLQGLTATQTYSCSSQTLPPWYLAWSLRNPPLLRAASITFQSQHPFETGNMSAALMGGTTSIEAVHR